MAESDVDRDGQPVNSFFNLRRNQVKAASALRGILEGVVADEKLRNSELLFLDAWLRSQRHLKGGDIVDLLDLIGEVLRDGIITQAEKDEALEVIGDILDFGEEAGDEPEAQINELTGFLLGISADNEISRSELAELDRWLKDHEELAETWPASEVIRRIEDIKEDGVVTDEELEDLLETVKQISGQQFQETGEAADGVAEVFSDDVGELTHEGKKMCFTGKFVCGTRSAVEKSAKEKGAKIAKNVSQSLDVLVVGTIASRDWRFSSHGRKIEQALEHRQNGTDILILSERHWRSLV